MKRVLSFALALLMIFAVLICAVSAEGDNLLDNGDFNTHEYLSGVKYGNSDFNDLFDTYAAKYTV